jgi:broad specificity phosphatase PhoE
MDVVDRPAPTLPDEITRGGRGQRFKRRPSFWTNANVWASTNSSAAAISPSLRSKKVDRDLLEWNYGNYDGRTSVDTHAERPDWLLFRDGCPGGEMRPHLHYLRESR